MILVYRIYIYPQHIYKTSAVTMSVCFICKVEMATLDDEAHTRLLAEIGVLKKLFHKCIMTFQDWWYNDSQRTINFITEVCPSGTLRQ